MNASSEFGRWHDPASFELSPESSDASNEFDRLWRGFMTARVTIGVVLILLHGGSFVLDPPQRTAPLMISSGYLVAALVVRLQARARPLGNFVDAQWLYTVGLDVLAFAALQMLQDSPINYAPLLALPALMAAVLGPMLIALGTAAGITLLLLAYAAWESILTPLDTSAHLLQAALTGAGCFAISVLAHQIATRLTQLRLKAQRDHLAARLQRQVNTLVIESLAEGVLVVDARGQVRSANPAACKLLDNGDGAGVEPLDLTQHPGWLPLLQLVRLSFDRGRAEQAEISIHHQNVEPRQLRVRTQLTGSLRGDPNNLCVVFMQDQRELQARIRTEKLASLGRLSAAIAHEIRNPLAAITQANGLLAEDLHEPDLLRLTRMIQQNSMRLDRIVNDVLQAARTSGNAQPDTSHPVDLRQSCERICRDWAGQNRAGNALRLDLDHDGPPVWFDAEHLRRVLINLLDNAHRHASLQSDSIQVSIEFTRGPSSPGEAVLRVWSDGAPLDASVEKHLFEPFFSSGSRSSGLGLHICRELCESHAASIGYCRSERMLAQRSVPGNEFQVRLHTGPARPQR